MTGPFNPKMFQRIQIDEHFYQEIGKDAARALARLCNEISEREDAKRWECSEGGEHAPVVDYDAHLKEKGHFCFKCGSTLRARWEAV